ncbi:sulfatase-like hydrolase/transferase [uncultured Cocleimonas sp.]|uniref:sulfatase-like hydrolase/transferase n=1 Tax=uncultured Cocleimonas sp. TaxID=1051587 RepID=UPI0026176883|nr:sulfatase-like hydrolase/transferase [uncultured Cocleimonas sp.]
MINKISNNKNRWAKQLNISVYILLILAGLSFLQSINSPFDFINEAKYLSQPYDLKGFMKSGIYIGVYIASLIAVALAIFTRNKTVFIFLISLISVAYAIDLFIQFVGSNEKGLSIATFSLGMTEKTRANDMLLFKQQLIEAAAVIAGFVFFAILSRNVFFKKFRVNTFLSLGIFIFMSAITLFVVLKIFSVVAQAFPAPIKAMAIASEYYLENKAEEPRVLSDAVIPTQNPEYKTIVWIIDESIGGQYLSVNGYEKDTTPYLKELEKSANNNFQNYGIVPSIANCSASTNLMLRIGLNSHQAGDFKENLKTLPTIFQYAKRAGYKTHLIDAQVAPGQLQNHLSVYDKSDIDNFVTFSRKHIPNTRDQKVLESLTGILDNKDNTAAKLNFIVVVKLGAHWPYPLSYPIDQEFFKPATRESYTAMIGVNKELILNAYYNSIRFSVDKFLKELTENRNLDDKVIIYTADHGQTLFYNDDPLTHCHSGRKIPIDEFKVPLMVFANGARESFKKPIEKISAQEQMFPTTLRLMGFPENIYNPYGPTLGTGVNADSIQSFIMLSGKKINIKTGGKWGGVTE